MKNLKLEKKYRDRLQDALVTIRTVGGWNAQEFAELIGVSRQYYSELENHSRDFTQSLYLATRFILEKAAEENKELKEVLKVCMDDSLITNEQVQTISKFVAAERKKKSDESSVKEVIYSIVGAAAAVSAVGIIIKAITKK